MKEKIIIINRNATQDILTEAIKDELCDEINVYNVTLHGVKLCKGELVINCTCEEEPID